MVLCSASPSPHPGETSDASKAAQIAPARPTSTSGQSSVNCPHRLHANCSHCALRVGLWPRVYSPLASFTKEHLFLPHSPKLARTFWEGQVPCSTADKEKERGGRVVQAWWVSFLLDDVLICELVCWCTSTLGPVLVKTNLTLPPLTWAIRMTLFTRQRPMCDRPSWRNGNAFGFGPKDCRFESGRRLEYSFFPPFTLRPGHAHTHHAAPVSRISFAMRTRAGLAIHQPWHPPLTSRPLATSVVTLATGTLFITRRVSTSKATVVGVPFTLTSLTLRPVFITNGLSPTLLQPCNTWPCSLMLLRRSISRWVFVPTW